MADILDGLTLIDGFSRFIPALLVLVVTYAVMLASGKLGENQFINSMVAFALAAMVLLSPEASFIINFIAPWFVILFVFILFILIAFKSTGVTDSMIMSVMKSRGYIAWTIVFIGIAITLLGVGKIYGQGLLEGTGETTIPGESVQQEIVDFDVNGEPIYNTKSTATNNYEQNVNNTIFHPAILGLGLIGLIAAFTVFFMTKTI